MKYLVLGLGNIGPEYELTRHNIGFLILDRWADQAKVAFQQGRQAFVTETRYKGRIFILVKPTTYMNLSGKALQYWMQAERIPVERTMVITDDIALPFGKIRIKPKGSSGGHNGMKHIEQTLGTAQYPRLRFGVGDDFPKGGQVDYVLSPFKPKEFEELVPIMDRCIGAVQSFATIGLDRTMNQFNG
jgi:PTH1 family peptidyl-tRNA hydrolase